MARAMEKTRKRSCDGKKAYGTYDDGLMALKAIVRNTGALHIGLNVYRCEFCGQHHVGNRPRRFLKGLIRR